MRSRKADRIRRLTIVGHGRRDPREGAEHTSFGWSVDVVVRSGWPAVLQFTEMLDRKDLASRQHDPEAGSVVRVEVSELHEQRQRGGR